MNAAGLGTTIHFFANNSARTYGDEPFTLEELLALKVLTGMTQTIPTDPRAALCPR